MLAGDSGVEIREEKTNERSGFSTLVTVAITGKDGTKAVAAGTLAADGSPRLVRWGQYDLDAHLNGAILVIRNEDKPGVIGSIGTLLGQAKINVNRMQVGLDAKTREAAALWAVDSAINDDLLSKIRASNDVKHAFRVQLS
jgi:D-3-phosphoglycerate dehydrogenase